jgi:transposase InsO family protein
MESYCRKCKKNTPSVKEETVKTANNRWRKKSICAVCNSKKSTFIKIVEPKGVVEARELHRPVIKKFPKRRIVMKGIDDLWACDLVIMNAYAKENDGYKYMLNVIDTFSKYAWSEPLKTKGGIEVAKAFENIIKRAAKSKHKSPKLLHSDKGREFENKDFKQMLKRYNIRE